MIYVLTPIYPGAWVDQKATRVDNRDGMTQVPRVLLHEVARYANGSLLKTSIS